jgi:hypothetical protein
MARRRTHQSSARVEPARRRPRWLVRRQAQADRPRRGVGQVALIVRAAALNRAAMAAPIPRACRR